MINIGDYGAVGDGVYLHDGAISSSSSTLTSATASFSTADVGKVIKINGAGASARDLTTTISGYNSPTSVTISIAASTTVSGSFIVYGSDDTGAIQSAINAVFATPQKSGTISFPDAIYVINGALQTSVSGENPNCQLYLPVLDNTVNALPSITFMGETSPFPASSRKVGTVVLSGGAILHSTLVTGSGTFPSVFGGCNTTVAINNATFVRASFENIHVRVGSNAVLAGPVITQINGARLQALQANDVVLDADCVSHASLCVMPTTEAAGIIYPQINTSNNTSSKNVYVAYSKYGVVTGELMTLLNAIVVTCNYPYVFTAGNYPVLCGHLRVTHCPNSTLVASSGILPAYAGPSLFDIQQLDVEVETAGGNWQDGVTGLIDVDNNGTGKITYSYVDSTLHTQTPFIKAGGAGIYTNLFSTLGTYFGSESTGVIYDEANNILGIGASPVTYPLEVYKSINSVIRVQIKNTFNGAASQAQLTAMNNTGLLLSVGVKSSGFATNQLVKANQATIISTATDSFLLGSTTPAPLIIIYGGTTTTNEVGRFDANGLNFGQLLKSLTFSAATNKMLGQVTLMAGTIAVTITGLTTSHRAFVQLVTANTTALTTQYQAVCTANTLTIRANVAAGTINTADVSTLNYVIFLNS